MYWREPEVSGKAIPLEVGTPSTPDQDSATDTLPILRRRSFVSLLR